MTRCSRLLLLFWLPLGALGSADIEMEVSAGLGGQAVFNRSSEIKIRLFARNRVAGELHIIDANGRITVPVVIDAQTQKILWITVSPVPPDPLQVRLTTSTGKQIVRDVFFEYSNTPITLISNSIAAYQTPGRHAQTAQIRPVIISSASLPHSAQAYNGIRVVVADVSSLSGLSTRQYQAFVNYLSACNILLLSAASASVLEQVRNLSGCGGKFIQSYESLTEVSALLQKLKSQSRANLPSASSLMSLQQPEFQSKMVLSLTLFLAGYIVFVALANWRMEKSGYLLVLPAIAAAAGILVWSGAGRNQSISWAETQSGDSHVRVSSLLLLGGNRRGENKVTLEPDTQLFNFTSAGAQPRILHIDEGSRRELSVRTQLLAPRAFQLDSVGRQISPFTLQLNGGMPELVLRAVSVPDRARLLWRGHVYEVPVLVRGKAWQPQAMQKQLSVTAEEKLLLRHLEFDAPAILLPYTPTAVVADDIHSTGWLVIRHDPEQSL